MIIQLFNNDGSDSVTYEGTLEEIRAQAKSRIELPTWSEGWSEVVSE